MAWVFPSTGFNVTDKDGTWVNCRLVAEDDDTVTLEYTASNNGVRMRAQILREHIVSITHPVPAVEDAERFIMYTSPTGTGAGGAS